MADLQSRNEALIIMESGFMIALNILSLGGNIMVCIAVYRNTRLRTATNIYITALAISDLLKLRSFDHYGVRLYDRTEYSVSGRQYHGVYSRVQEYKTPHCH